jgi:hypothetical protein
VVLNSVKTNADLISALPLSKNSDEKLIDLMTLTLGFKPKHNYNVAQLTALCSAFCEILRNKGSLYAIETAANTLLHAEGIDERAMCYFPYSEGEYDYTTVNVFISDKLSDINLFKDLLDYILPAGVSCNIVRTAYNDDIETGKTNIVTCNTDSIQFYDNDGIINNRASAAGTDISEISKIPQLPNSIDYDNAYAETKPGLTPNTIIVQLPKTNENDEQN